jgi:hypothetical protein
MTGKEKTSVEAVIARRTKVREYKAQYMRNHVIASILGVTERTIEKDLVALREGFEDTIKQTGGKELAHAVLVRHERMLEKIQLEIAIAEEALRINEDKIKASPFDPIADERARYWRKELRALRTQQHEIEVAVSKFYQSVGFMPRVAERVDLTQRVVVNPLDGLVDDERDDERETKSGSDSSSKD